MSPETEDAMGLIESDRAFADQIIADFGEFEEGITDEDKLAQWIRNIRHAYSTPDLAQTPGVPDGYVLMPREATRAMTMAACDSLPSCEHVFGHAGEMLRNCYRKMVAVVDSSTEWECPNHPGCGCKLDCIDGWKTPSAVSSPERGGK